MKVEIDSQRALSELKELLWEPRRYPISRHYPELYRLYIEVAVKRKEGILRSR